MPQLGDAMRKGVDALPTIGECRGHHAPERQSRDPSGWIAPCGDWLYLIIGIAVVGVLTLVGLVTSGRRRKGVPPAGGTDVIAPPSPRRRRRARRDRGPAGRDGRRDAAPAEAAPEAPVAREAGGHRQRLRPAAPAAGRAPRARWAAGCWPC